MIVPTRAVFALHRLHPPLSGTH